ncbi:MAG: hypothetical protein HXX20_18700 [Chloroflexi bacterium]|nr:hypothetical protein [Chloroflexota bacterium]
MTNSEQNSSFDAVLRQTLEALPSAELVDLVMKLVNYNTEFRRELLKMVIIPPQVFQRQPQDQARVTKLKKQITKFFEDIADNLGDYYECEDISELDDFLNNIETFNPADQLELLPHLLEAASNATDGYGFSTSQLEQALILYGHTAAEFGLSYSDKKWHFDRLFGWLEGLDIWEYGARITAVKQSLEALASTPEDYAYLLNWIEEHADEISDGSKLVEWQAAFYLKGGDEANYLKVREAHLETEAHYYELATYWQNKGQTPQSLAILESWLEHLNQQRASNTSRPTSPYSSYSVVLEEDVADGTILKKLAEYYQSQNDDENLLRILLAQAEHKSATLELYQRVKTLAERLGRWSEVSPSYMGYIRSDDKVRAQIHLYEEEWEAALEIAQKQPPHGYGYGIIDLVAQAVKQLYPHEVIKLYEKLVAENIAGADRKHYQFAASYAAKIKEVYQEVLKDLPTWRSYVGQIRAENKRRSALQDEFGRL